MMKRRDIGGNIFALIIVGHEPFVARAGKMDHLQRHVPAAPAATLIMA